MTEKEINAAQFNHEAPPRSEAVEGYEDAAAEDGLAHDESVDGFPDETKAYDPHLVGIAAQRMEETRTAVNDLAGRFDKVEEHLAAFHRRSAHRESVIDMLHEENQQLRLGIGKAILEPIVADLIRLYDQIDREVRRLKADGQDKRLLWSFADDITQILDRCGVEIYSAQPGDPFDRDRHRPLGVVTCMDEAQHNTVAEVAAAGFAERETGRVRRPVQALFYQYTPAGEPAHDDGAARSQ
jgi:molecular chaperone GrpE